jgi:hypothetical protein
MPGQTWKNWWRGAGWAAVWCAAVFARSALAAPDDVAVDDAQPAAAETGHEAQPADGGGEARALVKQLGDPDFKVRESAAKRLKEMGREALPALTEALAQANDPEVCSRADALMRRIQKPVVPSDWLRGDAITGFGPGRFGPGGFGAMRGFAGVQVRTSVVNGRRVVEVNGGGERRVTISEGPGGIDMTIVGVEDGAPVTARFRARSAEELRENDPDAFAIYQRWSGNGRAALARGRRLVAPGMPVPLPMPAPLLPPMPLLPPGVQIAPGGQFQARVLPMPAPARQPADDIAGLSDRIGKQMRDAGVPDDQQQAVRNLLQVLENMQAQGRAAQPADVDRQVQRYNTVSDALRQKLAALKLPEPGEALPPPASARLGISGQSPIADPLVLPGAAPGAADGVLVTLVAANSRGAKLGLSEGDVIKSINGKPVANVMALRRMVSELKEPLVIEVIRAGKTATLKEKAAGGQ